MKHPHDPGLLVRVDGQDQYRIWPPVGVKDLPSKPHNEKPLSFNPPRVIRKDDKK